MTAACGAHLNDDANDQSRQRPVGPEVQSLSSGRETARTMAVIVDYQAGNLRSVQRACEKIGLAARISSSPEELLAADRVIFPGVGTAASAVDTLHRTGLGEALVSVFEQGRPILGICLGAQIVLDSTEEGDRPCLGLLPGTCRLFRPSSRTLKVPHIGWNQVRKTASHPLLVDTEDGDEFYFVHSYYCEPARTADVYGVTDYGVDFCSVLGRKNLFATQFHLEKSGETGLRVLRRFADWDGIAG